MVFLTITFNIYNYFLFKFRYDLLKLKKLEKPGKNCVYLQDLNFFEHMFNRKLLFLLVDGIKAIQQSGFCCLLCKDRDRGCSQSFSDILFNFFHYLCQIKQQNFFE